MKAKITRAKQKEITRQRLINAAMNLFAQKGMLSTTTAEIANAIDMSHGSVFIHFPTREDLVNAVIDEFGKSLSMEFKRAVNHDYGLSDVLKAHLRVLEEFEGFYSRLVIESPMLPLSVRGALFTLQGHLLFNTWISLIHYYLANKDLFAPNSSVIGEKGNELLKHYISLIKK
jgi:TetR/AcrR family transcriptional regulator, acrEF/envCD operon repressor